jgi:hypothetical protein
MKVGTIAAMLAAILLDQFRTYTWRDCVIFPVIVLIVLGVRYFTRTKP